jgi:hypothetical protein
VQGLDLHMISFEITDKQADATWCVQFGLQLGTNLQKYDHYNDLHAHDAVASTAFY